MRGMLVMAPVSELRVTMSQEFLRAVIQYAKVHGVELEVQANDEGMIGWIAREFPEIVVSRGVLLDKRKRDARRKYLADASEMRMSLLL